jgi:hypothetical protein
VRAQERVQTINQQAGEAAIAAQIQLVSTDMTELGLECWATGASPASIYVFEEELTLPQCEAIVHETANPVNCLLVIASGRVKCPMKSDAKVLTVYFEGKNEGTISRACCIKTIETPVIC